VQEDDPISEEPAVLEGVDVADLQELAEQGDAAAQYNLGSMSYNGKGVLQDYVRAHMWANLSAAQGEENGRGLRETLAALMTPEQIAQAQAMARGCLESDYSDCD
jgi:hypothetical protein